MNERYKPFDQRTWLGDPPWADSPELRTWEHVHGHDARLKCFPEFGCLVIGDDAYDRGAADERERIAARLRRLETNHAEVLRWAADLIESEAP